MSKWVASTIALALVVASAATAYLAALHDVRAWFAGEGHDLSSWTIRCTGMSIAWRGHLFSINFDIYGNTSPPLSRSDVIDVRWTPSRRIFFT
jgi:hypothetical protein